MGGSYWLLVLVGVAALLTTGHCLLNCKGVDGNVGQKGAPGRDGFPGAKGEKGEPAVMSDGPVEPAVLLRLKGEAGSRGPQGPMGPKGYQGLLGPPGSPGEVGRPGPDGENIGQGGQQSPQQSRSAFSVIWTGSSYPSVGRAFRFQTTVVNIPGHFTAASGQFTCSVPGVYYFTFHSVAKVTTCLYIASQALTDKLGFCDYHKAGNKVNDQVLSGGVVLQLTAGQKVWLEPYRTPTDPRDSTDKKIIFSGFLLFLNPLPASG